MAPSIKTHNAIKHADEFLLVNDKAAAIQCLYDSLDPSKNKVWTDYIEEAINKLLDICIDIRECEAAKEALSQYRNICQLLNPEKMTSTVNRFLDACEAQIKNAQTQYNLTDCSFDNMTEDVDPISIFDSLSLDENDPKRLQREVVYPLVLYCWENIRNIIDLVKVNSTMEELYHNVCERAFNFCVTYHRINEFSYLRRLLHKHLDYIMNPAQDQANMKFRVTWSNNTAEKQLNTRFIQLEAACKLNLWSEAFYIITDIRIIISYSNCKPSLKSTYFDKLADVFLQFNNYFYHSYALLNLFSMNKKQNKIVTEDVLADMACKLLLASLCIPSYSVADDENHPMFKLERQKEQNIIVMLNIPSHITRASIHAELLSLEVLSYVPKELCTLYSILESELHPLDMSNRVIPILEWIEEQGKYVQYLPQLRKIILLRMLQQLESMYSVIRLDNYYHIIDELKFSRFNAERLIMEASACGQLHIRIDIAKNCVYFKQDRTEDDVLSNYISTLHTKLMTTMAAVNPNNTSTNDQYEMLMDSIDQANRVKNDINDAMNERFKDIEEKKLEEEREERDKNMSENERMKRENEQRELREQARLKEEEERRMKEMMERERKEREERDRQIFITELKQLQGKHYNAKAIADMNIMELAMYVQTVRDTTRKEKEEYILKGSENQLFLIRALREKALPGMLQFYDNKKQEVVDYWTSNFNQLYEQREAQQKKKEALLPVGERLSNYLNEYAERVMTRRVKLVQEEVDKRFEEAEKKRKEEEEKKRKEEEARRKAEEERRKAEEARRKADEERRRAEEERRRKQEEEEERVELARKLQQEKEAEERKRRLLAEDSDDEDDKPKSRRAPRAARSAPRTAPRAAPDAPSRPARHAPGSGLPRRPLESDETPAPVPEVKKEEDEWHMIEVKRKPRRAPGH